MRFAAVPDAWRYLAWLALVTGCGRLGFDAPAGEAPDAAVPPLVPDASAVCGSSWGAPSSAPFAQVNQPGVINWGAEISGDGLRLVFSSNRLVPGSTRADQNIYITQRAALSDAFDPPALVNLEHVARRDDRDPSLTEDALELYFVSEREIPACIYVAKRPDAATQTWSAPKQLMCMLDLGGVYVSRDGLRLYYDDDRDRGGLSVASRPDRTVDFTAGAPIGAAGLDYCVLEITELAAVCETTTTDTVQLARATRTTSTASFDAGQIIGELSDLGRGHFDPSITSDGTRLVYAVDVDLTSADVSSTELNMVERDCR